MTGEIEAVGAATTAGLVAAAIERGDAQHAATGPCANCGAEISGRFCANCGQPAHVHRSLLHMGEEALHGLFHFDTKTWRTLPRLALRPGTLTRDYIDGKRARYVSPLALFLFVVFITFAVIALTGGVSLANLSSVQVNGQDMRDPQARAAMLAQLQNEREQALAQGNREDAEDLANTIALINSTQGGTGALGQTLADAARSGKLHVNTGDAKRDEQIKERLENPELLFYKVEQAAYKFAFLLIPISLPFIALLFLWKRGVTWFDHAVFALYSLSFMCLFFLIIGLLTPAMMSWMPTRIVRGLTLTFVPPAHMFSQLRGAYQLGVFSALWRTFALLIICAICFSIFIGLIVLVGLLG